MMNYYLQSTNDNTDRTADIMAPGCNRVGCEEMGSRILENMTKE
jgi:hypothetical protein